MRFSIDSWAVALLLASSVTPAFAHLQPAAEIQELQTPKEALDTRDNGLFGLAYVKKLWKRKGAGGHGGKGSSSSGKSGKTSSSSDAGGSTKKGSGVTPNYGGGRYYGGGATTPYTSGSRSPLGIVPVFLGVGLLSIYPGLWLYGAYMYPYYHPYTFYNQTATNSTTSKRDSFEIMTRQSTGGVNQTKPVTCLCARYAECGCDDDNSTTFLNSVIGNGSYAGLNKSLIIVSDVNGTSTILLNGTLPNGTTASSGANYAAARTIIEASGYWVMIAIVCATVYFA